MDFLSGARPETNQSSIKLLQTQPIRQDETPIGGDIRKEALTESTKPERMNMIRHRASQYAHAGRSVTISENSALPSQRLAHTPMQADGCIESRLSLHSSDLSVISNKLEYFLERHSQGHQRIADSAKMMDWCRDMADKHAGRALLVFNIQNSSLIKDEEPRRTSEPLVSGSVVGYTQHPATFSSGPQSSAEICQNVADAIADMNKNYLEVFQDAVELYATFFSDFSDLMGELYKFISAKDDRTVLDVNAFARELDKFLAKYPINPPNENTTLFSGTKEECEAWAKEFGLDTNKSVKFVNGSYVVVIDTSPVLNIRDSLNNFGTANTAQEFNVAQWQAWIANVDMQKESVSNNMQTMTQKYANASSTFDNLVKVLSSTISSLLDTDKSFFNI